MKRIFLLFCLLLSACVTERHEHRQTTFVPASSLSGNASISSRQPFTPLTTEERQAVLQSADRPSQRSMRHQRMLRSQRVLLRNDDDIYVQRFYLVAPENQHILFEPGQSYFARVMLEDDRDVAFQFSLELDGEEISGTRILRTIRGNHAIAHFINIPITKPGFLEAGSRHLVVVQARTVGLSRPVRFSMLPILLEQFQFPVQSRRETRSF